MITRCKQDSQKGVQMKVNYTIKDPSPRSIWNHINLDLCICVTRAPAIVILHHTMDTFWKQLLRISITPKLKGETL